MLLKRITCISIFSALSFPLCHIVLYTVWLDSLIGQRASVVLTFSRAVVVKKSCGGTLSGDTSDHLWLSVVQAMKMLLLFTRCSHSVPWSAGDNKLKLEEFLLYLWICTLPGLYPLSQVFLVHHLSGSHPLLVLFRKSTQRLKSASCGAEEGCDWSDTDSLTAVFVAVSCDRATEKQEKVEQSTLSLTHMACAVRLHCTVHIKHSPPRHQKLLFYCFESLIVNFYIRCHEGDIHEVLSWSYNGHKAAACSFTCNMPHWCKWVFMWQLTC